MFFRQNDPLLWWIGVVLVVFLLYSATLVCVVRLISAIWSNTSRYIIRRHWLVYGLGIACSTSVVYSTCDGFFKELKRIQTYRKELTIYELTSLSDGLKQYRLEYGHLPLSSDNAQVHDCFGGGNPKGEYFAIGAFWSGFINKDGEFVDGWRTPLRFSFADPNNPVVQSAGPDRIWDTPDDLYSSNFQKKH